MTDLTALRAEVVRWRKSYIEAEIDWRTERMLAQLQVAPVQPDCRYGWCPYKACIICRKETSR